MAAQPSYHPLQPSGFFADGRSARPLVSGTVARGHLQAETLEAADTSGAASALGMFAVAGGNPLTAAAWTAVATPTDTFPFEITQDILQRGRERYAIFCVVCHDPAGTGHGKIVERGYTQPPSYHEARLRAAPIGHFYDVITHGYGSMPDHAAQIHPRDRWAIVAYIRALQASQHWPLDDLPKDEQAKVAATEGAP
jgi:mono/diheme cytochrome c family protein